MRYVDGMPNSEYHNPHLGASTTTIKDFIADPSSVKWSQDAPQDEDKMPAIDFGTDFHSYFLEPDEFKKHYKVLDKVNRRTNEGKAHEAAQITEFKQKGITPVTDEDMHQLEQMRLSALANPTVNHIMKMDNGIAERSFFWKDSQTDLDMKCRPDWLVTGINDSNRPEFMKADYGDCETLIVDVKTISRMDQLQSVIENLGYYIQDPFYTKGVETVTNTKACFLFVFVSTSLSIGRYPVKPVMLSPEAKFDGRNAINDALPKYAEMLKADDSVWQTAITMDRPHWAIKDEELI